MALSDEWSGARLYRLHTSGGGDLSWKQILEKTGLTIGQARWRVKRYIDNLPDDIAGRNEALYGGIPVSDLVAYLRKGPRSLRELSQRFDRSEETLAQVLVDMKADGYAVIRDGRVATLSDTPAVDFTPKALFPRGGQETLEAVFAIASDTHIGSKHEQPTALRDFVHIAREEYGVGHVLHAGDVFAGRGIYKGQESEIYAISGEDQADAAAHNLPQIDGVRWYTMGGNHDYSYYKLSGLDARRDLAKKRPDVALLPFDAVELPLLPGISTYMWHPSGGMPYALSYRGQKGAEQISQQEMMDVVMGEKKLPTIRLMLIGHLHTLYQFDWGAMAVLGCGCFEGRNSYIKRKGLAPHIGGWIVQCRFVDGMLHRMKLERFRYREIEDDWRPYFAKRQAQRAEVETLEPIFWLPESTDKNG